MPRQSKLEAVNTMLQSIQESPVNSLTSGSPDALIAEKLLDKESRRCQERGWWFNTEQAYPLIRDENKEILIPTTCLRVDEDKIYYNRNGTYFKIPNIAQRGNRLYNRETRSFTFEDSEATIYATMVMELSFEDVPEVCKEYVALRAARIFQDRVLGETTLHGFQQIDEQAAYQAIRQAELEAGDYNYFQALDMLENLDRTTSTPGWLYSGNAWRF